ncbi:amidohydrolase, partial [Streptomyces sp. NPDC054835]
MIDPPSLVDQYCHGVLRTELGLGTFETHLAPAPPMTRSGHQGVPPSLPAAGTTFFDTQTGFAVRRWCPPLLGLEPHCPPARYLARRRELGVVESGRRLLRASGIDAYLVDTGLPGDLYGPADRHAPADLTGPAELAATGAAAAHEIVRLELLAQQVADTSGTVDSFLANLAEAVRGAAAGAVAFLSAAALRGGLTAAPEPPWPGEVRGAAGRWLARRRAGEALDDPVLLRHLLWIAVGSGRPLQLYVGERDPSGL